MYERLLINAVTQKYKFEPDNWKNVSNYVYLILSYLVSLRKKLLHSIWHLIWHLILSYLISLHFRKKTILSEELKKLKYLYLQR